MLVVFLPHYFLICRRFSFYATLPSDFSLWPPLLDEWGLCLYVHAAA